MNKFLVQSAYNVLKSCLQIKENEHLLIVADDQQQPSLIEAFVTAGILVGAKVGQTVYPTVEKQNAEPMDFIAASLKTADAAVVLPKVSITHVEAIRGARKEGTRVLVCSGLDERMMLGAVNADYVSMTEITRKFVRLFEAADQVRVTCPKGTDVTFSVKGRSTMSVDGLCVNPGDWNFVPAGTTATAPLEGTTNGRIVFDGSLAPLGILEEPVVLDVESGFIRSITGGRNAEEFAELMKSFGDPNVYNIAEMGIGTNDKAELCGKLIEDERYFGAFHFGIGKSLNLGGTIDAPFHTDGMIMKPSVYVDGQLVVENGKILI